MPKGSAFEREIAKKLSLWWTGNVHDDIFWRSQNSGGRATYRKTKRTNNQYGDIAPTGNDGRELINIVTIEIKRGYNTNTLQDLIDRMDTMATQRMEAWYWQCYEAAQAAGSFSWLLIFKRDRREPLILTEYELVERLSALGCALKHSDPFMVLRVCLPSTETENRERLCCTTLQNWFQYVDPMEIKKLNKLV